MTKSGKEGPQKKVYFPEEDEDKNEDFYSNENEENFLHLQHDKSSERETPN